MFTHFDATTKCIDGLTELWHNTALYKLCYSKRIARQRQWL